MYEVEGIGYDFVPTVLDRSVSHASWFTALCPLLGCRSEVKGGGKNLGNYFFELKGEGYQIELFLFFSISKSTSRKASALATSVLQC